MWSVGPGAASWWLAEADPQAAALNQRAGFGSSRFGEPSRTGRCLFSPAGDKPRAKSAYPGSGTSRGRGMNAWFRRLKEILLTAVEKSDAAEREVCVAALQKEESGAKLGEKHP